VLPCAGTLTCTYDYQAVAECFRSAQGGTNFLNGVPFPYAQGGSSNCLASSSSSSVSSLGSWRGESAVCYPVTQQLIDITGKRCAPAAAGMSCMWVLYRHVQMLLVLSARLPATLAEALVHPPLWTCRQPCDASGVLSCRSTAGAGCWDTTCGQAGELYISLRFAGGTNSMLRCPTGEAGALLGRRLYKGWAAHGLSHRDTLQHL
jgi:hypothetical protein